VSPDVNYVLSDVWCVSVAGFIYGKRDFRRLIQRGPSDPSRRFAAATI
jgi:hypothetical protein